MGSRIEEDSFWDFSGDDWAPEGGWDDFAGDVDKAPKNEEELAREEEERDRANYDETKKNQKRFSGAVETDKTPEAEEKAFEIYRGLGAYRHNAVYGLMRASSEDIQKISDECKVIDETCESFSKGMDDDERRRITESIDNVKVEYVGCYDGNVMTPEMNDALVDRLWDAERRREENPRDIYRLFRTVDNAIQVASVSNNGEMFSGYYDLFTKYAGTPADRIPDSVYMVKSDLLTRYAVSHGLSEKRIKGFEEVVFPMVEVKDPEAESLMESMNSWGNDGDFGISDFTIHALTSEVNPRNVCDLMQIYRNIPTSDYKRFESNRRDALALQGVLWHGRDFIHDERPGVHELLEAMVEFYDSKENPEEHTKAEENLRAIVDDRLNPDNKYLYSGFDGEKCFDLENYDEELATYARSSSRDEGVSYSGVKAIEVLRRLEENTRQVSLEKPKSGDEELDELIEKLEVIEKNDGTVDVDFNETAKMVKRTNEILASRQYEIGIRPSFVKTLSYVERMATEAMRGIRGKDYKELAFDPGFKEIVKFNELTTSGGKFSEGDFDRFWDGFVSRFGKTWEDNPGEGYRNLLQRVLMRLYGLAQQYRVEGKPRYMVDSLWSGNLTHELIGLTDER